MAPAKIRSRHIQILYFISVWFGFATQPQLVHSAKLKGKTFCLMGKSFIGIFYSRWAVAHLCVTLYSVNFWICRSWELLFTVGLVIINRTAGTPVNDATGLARLNSWCITVILHGMHALYHAAYWKPSSPIRRHLFIEWIEFNVHFFAVAPICILLWPLYFCPVVSFSIFFPRLFSAAGDWMSTILPHMVWP